MKRALVVLAFLAAVLVGCQDAPGRVTENELICDRYNDKDSTRQSCAQAHREITVQAASGRTYMVRTLPVEYYDLAPGDAWPVPANARSGGRP